jgi:hypothetical protein
MKRIPQDQPIKYGFESHVLIAKPYGGWQLNQSMSSKLHKSHSMVLFIVNHISICEKRITDVQFECLFKHAIGHFSKQAG